MMEGKVIQEKLLEVVNPLHSEQWAVMLADHPDKDHVDYILSDIKEGFRIGFDRDTFANGTFNLSSARKIAEENAQTVRGYLQPEKQRGALLGPFSGLKSQGFISAALVLSPNQTAQESGC